MVRPCVLSVGVVVALLLGACADDGDVSADAVAVEEPAAQGSAVEAPGSGQPAEEAPAGDVGRCGDPDDVDAGGDPRDGDDDAGDDDAGEGAPLVGFGEVAFRVQAAAGTPAFEGCALFAATPEARAQGLMGQTDLLGYDAMVFRFAQPTAGAFYMFRTVIPLSIAFVAADGDVVSTADMEPCAEEVASACPTYPAAAPFLHAIEVEQGRLDDLGIEPGATVTFR